MINTLKTSRKRDSRSGMARRGVVAIEFAILLPVLAFLFLVALDFARVYYGALIAGEGARNAAISVVHASEIGNPPEVSYASAASAAVWR